MTSLPTQYSSEPGVLTRLQAGHGAKLSPAHWELMNRCAQALADLVIELCPQMQQEQRELALKVDMRGHVQVSLNSLADAQPAARRERAFAQADRAADAQALAGERVALHHFLLGMGAVQATQSHENPVSMGQEAVEVDSLATLVGLLNQRSQAQLHGNVIEQSLSLQVQCEEDKARGYPR